MSHGVVDEPLAGHRRVASRSADVLREAVAELAVGHDVVVRGGLLDGLVNGAAVGSVNLVYVRYGGRVLVEAPATGPRVAVTVPLGPMEVRSSRERQTFSREGFVLSEDRATVMRPDPHAGAIVIAVDRARLDHALARLAGSQVGTVEFGARWTAPVASRAIVDATWRHVGAVLAALPTAPPIARRALETTLLDAILLGMPHSHSSLLAAPPLVPGAGHAERARAWMEEHYRQTVAVADVAAGVGLSVRQLQEVVRRRFGLTPMQLLRQIRLERARQLLAAGIAPSVAAAAMEVGCTHLGRFAAAYRAHFGELPSETGPR